MRGGFRGQYKKEEQIAHLVYSVENIRNVPLVTHRPCLTSEYSLLIE